ncbi:MAG: PKD domain-containing protein [Myxococcaceae bacterium]|nr:PKD domain-containing protein [Myxococcaceae bacterium]MCA3015282.1 PKD domain-containing protein [Myxococcaceae bacterium]
MRPYLTALALLSCGCVRAVREERRTPPVDTGHAVSFRAEGPRRWDFGDGQAGEGVEVAHTFDRAGRYEVRAFEGDRLTDRVSVLVQPRDPFRAVAPSAEAALVFRSLDELPPAVDFLERLGSAATVQRALERTPLFAFALEPGPKGTSALDRLEGAGLYWPQGLEAAVAFVGVVDGPSAREALSAWLIDRGYQASPARAGRFALEGVFAEVFVDRGTLFMVTGSDWEVVGRAAEGVRRAPARGLEGDPVASAGVSALASGGVALVVTPPFTGRRPGARAAPGARWSVGVAALRFGRDDVRLIGRLLGSAPLWNAPSASRPQRLLAHAPGGPVALLAADVPLAQALDAVVPALVSRGPDDGAMLQAGLEVVSRRLDAALYFDAEAFLLATVAARGRPSPRVTLLGEAAVPDRPAVERVVGQLLSRRKEGVDSASEGATTVWRTRALEGHELELALDADTLYARLGRPLSGRAATDFVSALGARAEGACGPGHLTAFVDAGQLARELLEPRMVPGLDPRRVVLTQALTSTFLSQLTAIDTVLLDVAPAADGATVLLEVTLTPRRTKGPAP